MEKVRERTGLYHEHQQGYLCAQHALNNLLQDSVFSADTLAVMARQLDAEEKSVLAHDLHESENVDDTGFFNIQVLQRALATFNLELVPFNSQDQIAMEARNSPQRIQAYICNLGAHWFAIRRFAEHYFDLNSFQYVPMIMPTQILKQYFNMIEGNGYSVFIVSGQLPRSLADIQLETNPISYIQYKMLIKDLPKFVMDGKPMDDLKDFQTGEDMRVQVPDYILEKYQQNPNDPNVREMMNAYLPKGMVVTGITRSGGCSDPTHHHCHGAQKLLVAPVSEHRIEKKPSENLPPRQEKRDLMLSRQFANTLFDQPDLDQSDDLLDRSVDRATIRTQTLVRSGIGISSDGSTRQVVVIQQSTRVTRPSFANSEEDILRMMTPDDNYDDDEEEFLLQLMNEKQRLQAEGKNKNEIHRHIEDWMFQRETDKAIAASLSTPESFAKQSSELPKTNALPAITKETISSKPEIIPMPSSSTNTNFISPPSQNPTVTSLNNSQSSSSETKSSLPKAIDSPSTMETNSSLPKATNSPSAMEIDSSLPQATNSPSAMETDSSLPKATNSPSPTETKFESPTIEELRQRRLQTYARKDRSIISSYVPSDDEINT